MFSTSADSKWSKYLSESAKSTIFMKVKFRSKILWHKFFKLAQPYTRPSTRQAPYPAPGRPLTQHQAPSPTKHQVPFPTQPQVYEIVSYPWKIQRSRFLTLGTPDSALRPSPFKVGFCSYLETLLN